MEQSKGKIDTSGRNVMDSHDLHPIKEESKSSLSFFASVLACYTAVYTGNLDTSGRNVMDPHDPHPVKEELTPLEEYVTISYKSNPLYRYMTDVLASYTAAYAATWKLPNALRANFSTGAVITFAVWMFNKSLSSGVDQMLALNGSMLQKKVATILLTHCPEHPESVRLMSKHFYPERVLDDSTSDTPKLRWRYRNIFSDNVVHGHRTLALDDFYDSGCHYDPYHKFQGNSYNDSYDNLQCESESFTHSIRTTLGTKQNLIKPPDVVLELAPFGSFGLRCYSGRD